MIVAHLVRTRVAILAATLAAVAVASDVPLPPASYGGGCTSSTAATNTADRRVTIAIHLLLNSKNTSTRKVRRIFLPQRTQTDTIRKLALQATSLWIPFFCVVKVVQDIYGIVIHVINGTPPIRYIQVKKLKSMRLTFSAADKGRNIQAIVSENASLRS